MTFCIRSRRFRVVTVMLLAVLTLPGRVTSCPFCSAVTNTFSEDIAAMDAVVIARLTATKATDTEEAVGLPGGQQLPASVASFTIDRVLKGQDILSSTKTFSMPFFGDAQKGDLFLVMASDPQNLTWSPPLRLNTRQHDYLLKLVTLPKEGPERLAFFQAYLQDTDPLLSQDAYDEFARAPYATVRQLKDRMDHDQLVAWIENPDVSASHRRLYLTMLGVCGSKADLPMLEKRLRATDPLAKSGLDALIACYLTLRGPEGVELVEDLFFEQQEGNFSGEFPDVYSAIMALRFHGNEGDVIPRQRVIEAFHLLLDHQQMADLIISDLARWKDWSQLDRLVGIFKKADAKSSFVRMPIVNYVRACPLPEAKEALAEFKRIDPELVKRTMTFFPTLPEDAP